MTPASFGFPGGMELAVMAAMLILLLGVAFAVVTVGRSLFGGADDATAQRVADLEAKVDDLQDELAEERDDSDES